ncbi:hypothetical protein [Virgisporangium aurantiacum]|uniref:hypothetical protein n=1 Tax=Virgisporangium aurantiacum TaxID=175570 RepID=UPI00194E8E0B|nr:hypothetical protein [Virgisporangium aurantiacum]
MIKKLILLAAVVATGVTLTVVTTHDSEATTAPPRPGVPAPASGAAGPHTVTLGTGDRVTVAAPDGTNLSVRPGPGRTGMRFAVVRTGAGTYVVPRDTLARFRDGTVDRTRFEIATTRVPTVAPRVGGETHQLTIRYLDLTGAPTQDAVAVVSGWDNAMAEWPAVNPDGTSTVKLPAGRYNLGAYLGSGPNTTLLVQPVVDLTGDLTVTLDARVAGAVTLTVPEPSARAGFVDVGYSFYPTTQTWPAGMYLTGDEEAPVRIGQVGPPAAPGELVGSVAAQWGKPDGTGDFTDSPYLYSVAETFPGRLPGGFTRAYRPGDFATVHQQFAASGPKQSARHLMFPAVSPKPAGTSALSVPTTLPGSRVEYVQAGVRWSEQQWTGVTDASGAFRSQKRLYQQPTAYRPGRTYRDQWNAGPTGPAFGQEGEAAWQWASRQGDRIDVGLPLYGDRAGHAGSFVPTDESRSALYRDGELVGEFPASGGGSFTVPAEPAGYRLEVADTRSTDDLTTRVSAAWTFRSGHTDGTAPVRLPLPAVRFTPALDADNAAPANRGFDLPVAVESQPGAPAARIVGLTVEISYDDGATWSAVPVRPASGGWTGTVRHPAGAGFASLRATARDAAGTTVTQTLVRAYRIRA